MMPKEQNCLTGKSIGDDKMQLRIAGVEKESIVDGKGIRYVIFAQGCPHKCKGCHNPKTHSFEGGCLCEADELIEEIKKNNHLDGITCSGGECFEQAEAFAYIAKKVRAEGLSVWAYTGYDFEYILNSKNRRPKWNELINNIDVLVDGSYKEDMRDLSLNFRGSLNQRIIDIRKSLSEGKIVLTNM